MKRHFRWTAAPWLILVVAAACRPPALRPLSRESTLEVQVKPCAVLAHMPVATLRVPEEFERILWNERCFHSYSVDGLVDPRPSLESAVAETLREDFGVPVERARDRMEKTAVQGFSSSAEDLYRRLPAGLYDRPVGEQYAVFESAGFDYLFEVFLLEMKVVPGTWSDSLEIWVLGRFIRLKDRAVVGADQGRGIAKLEIDGFKDLARNNLAILKKGLEEAGRDLARKDRHSGLFAGNLFPR